MTKLVIRNFRGNYEHGDGGDRQGKGEVIVIVIGRNLIGVVSDCGVLNACSDAVPVTFRSNIMPVYDKITREATFSGQVVAFHTEEIRMSDYSQNISYAVVLTDADELEYICLHDYDCNAIDASEETMFRYLDLCERIELESRREMAHNNGVNGTIRRFDDAHKPTVGTTVHVIAGRKVPLGGIYLVREYASGSFGRYVNITSKDLKSADFKSYSYVSDENVEVVNPDITDPYCSACRERLAGWIENGFTKCRSNGNHLPVCGKCSPALIVSGEMEMATPFRGMEFWKFFPGEEAFAEALCLVPGDQCTWLVFADFVEENSQDDNFGVIRSEVIRTCVRPIKKTKQKKTA